MSEPVHYCFSPSRNAFVFASCLFRSVDLAMSIGFFAALNPGLSCCCGEKLGPLTEGSALDVSFERFKN